MPVSGDTLVEDPRFRRDKAPPSAGRVVRCPGRTWYGVTKVILEFALTLCLLVLTAPLVLLAALAIKLTSRGPVFYSQTRLGLGGRPYRMYKLRTMSHNCEQHSGARWAT